MWKVKSWELWEQCNYGTYLDTITWVKKEDFYRVSNSIQYFFVLRNTTEIYIFKKRINIIHFL